MNNEPEAPNDQQITQLIEEANTLATQQKYLEAFRSLLKACDTVCKQPCPTTEADSISVDMPPPTPPDCKAPDEAVLVEAFSTDEIFELSQDEPCLQEKGLRAFLEANLFGQPEAIEAGLDAYLKSISPIKENNRPCFVIMSLGQSRTGKSELPRLLAKYLHGSKKNLLRVNLAQYQHQCQITTLIGASPTWVGYEQPATFGQKKLTESRGGSRNKQIILVLEEIEKAHPAVADVLLGVFDNGEAELANGEVSDFSQVIIFMTSNLSSSELASLAKPGLGFIGSTCSDVTQTQIKNTVYQALAKHYRPEFVNRIDRLVIYRDLTDEAFAAIVKRELRDFENQLLDSLSAEKKFALTIDESARQHLFDISMSSAKQLSNTRDGVGSPISELQRVLTSQLSLPIQRALIGGKIKRDDLVTVTHIAGQDKLRILNQPGGGRQQPQITQITDSSASSPSSSEEPTLSNNIHRYFPNSKSISYRALPYEASRQTSEMLDRWKKSKESAPLAVNDAPTVSDTNVASPDSKVSASDNWNTAEVQLARSALLIGEVLEKNGKYSEARRLYENVRNLSGKSNIPAKLLFQTRLLLARNMAIAAHNYEAVSEFEITEDEHCYFSSEFCERIIVELLALMHQRNEDSHAIPILKKLISLQVKLHGSGSFAMGESHRELGYCYQRTKQPHAALDQFQSAVSCLQKAKASPQMIALMHCEQSALYRAIGEVEQSRIQFQKARMVDANEDLVLRAALLREEGSLEYLDGRYAECRILLCAAAEAQKALTGSQSIEVARILASMSMASFRMDELDRAAEDLESALEIFSSKALAFSREAGSLISKLGGIRRRQGRLIEASILELAGSMAGAHIRNSDDRFFLAKLQLGLAAERNQKLVPAEEIYQELLDNRRAMTKDPYEQLIVCGRLACVQTALNKAEAKINLELCLRIAEVLFGHQTSYQVSLQNLARLYRLIGNKLWSECLLELCSKLYPDLPPCQQPKKRVKKASEKSKAERGPTSEAKSAGSKRRKAGKC